MQELNPLHTHTGTGGDGRKLDATRALDKLGVGSSNEMGEVIISANSNVEKFTGATEEAGRVFRFPDASAAPAVRFGVISPLGAKKILGLDIFFFNSTPGSSIRFRTVINIINLGQTSVVSFSPAAFQVSTPPGLANAFQSIRLSSDKIFNIPDYLLTPGAFIEVFLERQSTNAADTFNANLEVQYFRLVFS